MMVEKNKKKRALSPMHMKRYRLRYEREETAKKRQLELEANQKQLEAGKWTMDQIINWDLD